MRRVTTRAGRAARAERNAIRKIDKILASPNQDREYAGGHRVFRLYDNDTKTSRVVGAVEFLKYMKQRLERLRHPGATEEAASIDECPLVPGGEPAIGSGCTGGIGTTFRPFDFGTALALLKTGRRLQRSGWNGPGQYIELQRPDENSKMNLPYVYIRTVQGQLVPWLASQTDLLAEDWRTVD